MIRIASAQIDPTIGDLFGNVALMRDAARKAQRQGAELVVFPELSLTAYYPADLLEDQAFLTCVESALDHLAEIERKMTELQSLHDELTHLAGNCHGDQRPDCPILEGLAIKG